MTVLIQAETCSDNDDTPSATQETVEGHEHNVLHTNYTKWTAFRHLPSVLILLYNYGWPVLENCQVIFKTKEVKHQTISDRKTVSCFCGFLLAEETALWIAPHLEACNSSVFWQTSVSYCCTGTQHLGGMSEQNNIMWVV